MLGTQRFLVYLVLTASVSFTLSNSQQGNIFSRLFNQGKGYFTGSNTHSSPSSSSSSASSSSARSSASASPYSNPAYSNSYSTPSNSKSSKASSFSSRSLNTNTTSGGGAGKAASPVSSASQARGYQSQRSQGWGWGGGGGDEYVYSHSTHGGKGNGLDLNTLIGGASLLGALGVLAYALFGRQSATTIMMVNMTGRRRRSADDFDDEMMEGETLPEFLNRIGKYLETSWGGENETQKVEPINLY